MTPAERTLRARSAAHTQWAKEPDRTARTAPARAGAEARFDRMVVESFGELPADEHAQRAEAFRSAFYADLARKSVKARRERAGLPGDPSAA